MCEKYVLSNAWNLSNLCENILTSVNHYSNQHVHLPLLYGKVWDLETFSMR